MGRNYNATLLTFTLTVLLAWLSVPARAAIYPAFINGVLSLGDGTSQTPYPLDETFNLSSRPSASKTIFLDFNGLHSFNNSWGHNITFPSYDLDGDTSIFSDSEREEIQKIFQNVAEDFLPFNVNVTTRTSGSAALSNTGGGDSLWGVRVVMTQATAGFGVGIGGNSGPVGFDDSIDNPVFVFNKGNRKGGQTASHEAGHTFGLSHDGLNTLERHPGTGGSGSTSWGPIMGAPFQATLSQWSNGDYAGATNAADDLSFITSRGFGFRPDDFLTSVANPQVLSVVDNAVFETGIIENRTDVDHFQFTTAPGNVSINVSGFSQDPNLDVGITLYDNAGAVVASFDQTVINDAFLDLTLEAGGYVLAVEGVGFPGRYSDYGSLGFYTIDIDLPLFADLNEDDLLDAQDWQLFIAGAESDLSGLTPNEAYLAGDLDGDGVNSIVDFGLFKDTFVEANGLQAFQSLFVQVPEPTALVLALIALARCPRRNRITFEKE